MDNPLKNIKTFVRNPLGIIGLFVTIAYLIAAILLGYGLDKLHDAAERLLLIWFVILFPLVILFTFYKLVTKHYNKLYGPSDFQKDEHFMTFANRDEVQHNNQEKLKDEKITKCFSLVASKQNNNDDKQTDDNSLMRSIVARDAVIVDKLSQEYGIQFYPNMKLRGISGSVVIDAYGMDKGKQYFVEIKLLRSFTTDEIYNIVNKYTREVRQTNTSLHIKYIFAFYCPTTFENDYVKEANSIHFSDDVDIVLFNKDYNIIMRA